MLTHEIVRIEPIRQKRELDAVARLQMRQRRLDGPEGRPASGGVAVEAQGRFGRHAPEQLELILGQGGAQRRDGLRKARFRQAQ